MFDKLTSAVQRQIKEKEAIKKKKEQESHNLAICAKYRICPKCAEDMELVGSQGNIRVVKCKDCNIIIEAIVDGDYASGKIIDEMPREANA